MTRPLTCLTLLAAAGAGLYLYQAKHQAQLLDREINRVVHAADQTRERTSMLRAEWAALNEPERLATLAAQHLSLQTVAPGQFAQLADLGSRLPPVAPPTPAPAAIPMDEPPPAPIATAEPPPRPGPVKVPLMVQTAPSTVLPPRPTAPLVVQAAPAAPAVQLAAARPPAPPKPVRLAAAKPVEHEPVGHPVYAPILPAFASQMPRQPIHAPMVQQAAAQMGSEPAPYVGSALGMAHTMLAAPVPVSSADR
jgi:cell division protein FtsL